jgi:hypothetical protein
MTQLLRTSLPGSAFLVARAPTPLVEKRPIMHFASETSKYAKVTEGEPVIAREQSMRFLLADRGNLPLSVEKPLIR